MFFAVLSFLTSGRYLDRAADARQGVVLADYRRRHDRATGLPMSLPRPDIPIRASQPAAGPLSAPDLAMLDGWWRAANYLSVGQIYLYDNPLLRQPLELRHIKPRLLGHWGTTPGLNFLYAPKRRRRRGPSLPRIRPARDLGHDRPDARAAGRPEPSGA